MIRVWIRARECLIFWNIKQEELKKAAFFFLCKNATGGFWVWKIVQADLKQLWQQGRKILNAQYWSGSETEETWVSATALGFMSYLEQMTSSVLVFHLQNEDMGAPASLCLICLGCGLFCGETVSYNCQGLCLPQPHVSTSVKHAITVFHCCNS